MHTRMILAVLVLGLLIGYMLGSVTPHVWAEPDLYPHVRAERLGVPYVVGQEREHPDSTHGGVFWNPPLDPPC